MPSLLDSSSMVSLLHQSYFDRYLGFKLGPAEGLKTSVHNLFNLKSANKGDIPSQDMLKWMLVS